MLPTKRAPTAPGVILEKEFLEPLELTQGDLAKRMDVPIQRINLIVNGKRKITAETALLLASALDTTPEFWMNLQSASDLWEARRELANERAQQV